MNSLLNDTDNSEIICPPLISSPKNKNIKFLDINNKKKLIIGLFKKEKEINKLNMSNSNNSKLIYTPQKNSFQSFSKNKSKLIKNNTQKKFNVLDTPKINEAKFKRTYLLTNENIKPKRNINEIFESLIDIRTQLKNLNIERNKKLKIQSNLKKPKKLIILKDYNNKTNIFNPTPKLFHYKENKDNSCFIKKNFSPKYKSKIISETEQNITETKKNPSKRSIQSIIMNNHIKYIQKIRDKELVDLIDRYKKSINKNKIEEINHYENRVFPNELIEYLIILKRQLTIDKYKNEYISKIDRYKTNDLMKAIKSHNAKYKLSRNSNNN